MRRRIALYRCLTSLLALSSGLVQGCSAEDAGALGTEFRGRFVTSIARYPDDTSRTFQRLEREDGVTLELLSTHPLSVPSGSELVVRGTLEGDQLVVDGYTRLADHEEREPYAAPGMPRTLQNAFLVLNQSYPVATAKKRLFEDEDSPKKFYDQNSGGTWILEGDAFGPYSISANSCAGIPGIRDIEQKASDAAKAAGVPIDTYDNVLIYLNGTEGCSWSGWGDMGHPLSSKNGFVNGRFALFNESDGCVVLTQELGHTYGLGHSHFCTGAPYSIPAFEDGGNGQGCPGHSEYGDPFTPMASGCGHFNAIEKAEMTFIGGCNILHVSQTGSFELVPIEQTTTETQVLRIANAENVNSGPQFVYVEYRKSRVGSDTKSQPGLYFHAGPDVVTLPNTGNPDPERVWASDPILLSPSGTASSAYFDSGEWTEPSSGVKFTVVELGDKAKVDLTFPSAGGGPPTCMGDGTGGMGGMGGTGGTGGGGGMGGAGGGSGDGGSGGQGGTAGGTGGTGGTAGSGGATGGAGGSSAGQGGSGATGGAGTGGGSSGIGGSGATSGSTETEGGCACEVTSTQPRSHLGAWALLGLGWVLRRRRR